MHKLVSIFSAFGAARCIALLSQTLFVRKFVTPAGGLRALAISLVLGACAVGVNAQTTQVPAVDAKGLSDPAGLKRFAGSVLLYRDDVPYDEIALPLSKPVEKNGKVMAPKSLPRAGQRTALRYVVPAGALRWKLCAIISKTSRQQALRRLMNVPARPAGFPTPIW